MPETSTEHTGYSASTAEESETAMSASYANTETPDGPFSVIYDVIDGTRYLLASGWSAEAEELLPQIHRSLRPESLRGEKMANEFKDAIDAYYDGDFAAVAQVPVFQRSGPFREHAWKVLRTIGPGRAVTYQEYAAQAGNPAAVRAAASACAFNAAALFVPCHRVVRTDGSLGGFRWGLPVKQSLLDRERQAA